jgi:hypothetical protein
LAKEAAALMLSICGVLPTSAVAEATPVGKATIPRDARDRSGRSDEVAARHHRYEARTFNTKGSHP